MLTEAGSPILKGDRQISHKHVQSEIVELLTINMKKMIGVKKNPSVP